LNFLLTAQNWIQRKNFFLRGYTTTEDGGQSYDILFTVLM
jgi:hypothetical protein